MAEFRFPFKSKDPSTERNNRSLMDWLRGNVGQIIVEDGEVKSVLRLNDLRDVNAGDPLDLEHLQYDAGSARWEAKLGIEGPPGPDGAPGLPGDDGVAGPEGPEGPAGVDGVDGSGSRASMLMLGGM